MIELITTVLKGSLTAILVVLAVAAATIGVIFFTLYAAKMFAEEWIDTKKNRYFDNR